MSKRKFGFEGFGIPKKSSFEFESTGAPRRLYLPSPPRKAHRDNEEDPDLDNIQFSGDEDEVGQRGSLESSNLRRHEEKSGSQGSFNEGYGRRDDRTGEQGSAAEVEQDAEVDPLDAFMEGIHEEVKKAPVNPKPIREELEDEEDDPMESFLRAHRDAGLSLAAEALHAGYNSDEEVYAAAKAVDNGMLEYDSDDNPVILDRKKPIDPLPQLEHSEIDYQPFNRDFYEEGPSISGMTDEEVTSYRESLSIKVSGFDVPRPVKRFEDLGFDSPLMSAILKQSYENPTPIQCQALPVALSGRDMIGIAKTGSGKTAAFVLPLIVHIMDQAELEKGEGPIGVICSPTRELAQQIYTETKKFAKVYGIRVSGVYGGMSKFEQFKELKAGCEIVVATPGRLIDMLKMKAVTMLRGTYLILDEADRMFDLGFEPQIRSIIGQMRPDRQTMLFSATMPRRVERLAREILSDPIRVTVGEIGMANEDITQVVTVLPADVDKLPWLLNRLPAMVDDGDTLIFASTKIRVEEVEGKLKEKGFKIAALHGDKDQASRMEVLKKFKTGVFHVLVATDVAARGLDIKSIKTVVNFDIAKDMDGHVHRIGRTGRAGDKDGVAHTLITQKEARFAGELVNSLIAAGQNTPMELMDLAMKDGRFRAQREGRRGGGSFSGGKGKGRGRGGRGGLGAGGSGGGGGRSVRGVDFGMGIGYNADSANKSSSQPRVHSTPKSKQQPLPAGGEVPSRGAAVDALKMGMMARFRSSFVPAVTPGVTGSSQAQNSIQGNVYGDNAGGDQGRGRALGSAVSPSSGFNSGSMTADGVVGQGGGWNRSSGGGAGGGGFSSDSKLPSFSLPLKSGGTLGGFVAAGPVSESAPRSNIYGTSMSTSTVGGREGCGNVNFHTSDNGDRGRHSSQDGVGTRDKVRRSRWDRDSDRGRDKDQQGNEKESDSSRSRERDSSFDARSSQREPK